MNEICEIRTNNLRFFIWNIYKQYTLDLQP